MKARKGKALPPSKKVSVETAPVPISFYQKQLDKEFDLAVKKFSEMTKADSTGISAVYQDKKGVLTSKFRSAKKCNELMTGMAIHGAVTTGLLAFGLYVSNIVPNVSIWPAFLPFGLIVPCFLSGYFVKRKINRSIEKEATFRSKQLPAPVV